jgi:outer membrane receptor protein involved in Fe transport
VRLGALSLAIGAALPWAAHAQDAPSPPAAKPDKTVGEVVVTGEQAAVQTGIDRRSYSLAADLKSQGGASVADALRSVPQVEVDVAGNVSLRGDGNVTILVDGKPSGLFQGDNKGQALQSLPADSIERVEVITNPSAEFRAEGSAGVINLITKKARGAGATGSLRATVGDGDRFSLGASGGYNSSRLNLTGEVGVRQDTQKSRTIDDRLTRDPASGGLGFAGQDQLTHILTNSFSARGSVDYDPTPSTRIGAEAHGSYTFFRVDGLSRFQTADAAGPDSFLRQLSVHQKRAQAEASVSLRQRLGAEGEAVLSLSHELIVDPRVRSGRTFGEVPASPDVFDQQRLDYRQRRTELKGDVTQPFADASKLKLGFDVEVTANDYRNRGFRGPGEPALAPDATLTNLFLFRRTIAAAYATYEKPVGDLTIQAGLRLEDTRLTLDQATLGQVVENDDLGVYPGLHLAWRLGDGQTLNASYSHRIQRPDPLNYNAFPLLTDPLNQLAGNPRLRPQQTQSYELGYERKASGSVLLATAYYRENRDGVADLLVPLGEGRFLTQKGNAASGRSGGLEVVASGKVWRTFSYSATVTGAWTQLDSLGPTFAPPRSLFSASGHGTLTWQPTAADLVQLNGFVNGRRLTPQGVAEPAAGFDLGYRRRLGDKLFLLVTLQDIFNSFRIAQRNHTPILTERSKTDFDVRQARIGLTWTFGGGRQRDPGFEFQTGGGPPQ